MVLFHEIFAAFKFIFFLVSIFGSPARILPIGGHQTYMMYGPEGAYIPWYASKTTLVATVLPP